MAHVTTTTSPALPHQRPALRVLHLRPAPDLDRRPVGAHALPDPDVDVDPAWWDAEAEALLSAPRPPEQHGRRCACCRPALAGTTEVA